MMIMLDVDRPPHGDLGRPQFPTPEWFIPSSSSILTEAEVPGWRSADMRDFPVGSRLLDRRGVVHLVEHFNATKQKVWTPIGTIMPKGWDIQLDEGWTDLIGAAHHGGGKVLLIRWQHAQALASYWMDATAPHRERSEDFQDFYQELAVQLHRPAPIRKAVMKVVKHPTRRGRATVSNVDPMTPWALRTASERLVADVSADLDHQADDVSLKRLVHLNERHEELQCQLDEVAGQLAAAKALLVSQERTVRA